MPKVSSLGLKENPGTAMFSVYFSLDKSCLLHNKDVDVGFMMQSFRLMVYGQM